MKTEKWIKNKLKQLKDDYTFGINYAHSFGPKKKYKLQGAIEVLEEVLNG